MQQARLAYPHRGHTRRGVVQTGGIFSTTKNATSDILGTAIEVTEPGRDVVMGATTDVIQGTENVLGSVAGGTADAAGGAWDWAVSGTKSMVPGGQQNEPVTGGGIMAAVGGFPTVALAIGVVAIGAGFVFYKKNIEG